MTRRRIHLLAGTALALTGAGCCGSAMADTSLGWYVATDVGHGPISSQSVKVSDVTLSSSANSDATPPLTSGTYKLEPDYSARGFLRAGYRLTPNLRAELEIGARPGKLIDGLGGSNATNLGAFDKTSLMANAIVDFWPEMGLHPFVGVGAGMVNAKADYREAMTLNGHTVVYSIDDSRMVPAGQFLAGASWDVTEHLHFDMTYRYLRTGSTNYDIGVTDTYGPSANPITDTYTAHGSGPIEDHSLTIGLRWTFGAPLAPAAVPQAVALEAAPTSSVPPIPPARSAPPAMTQSPMASAAVTTPVATTQVADASPAEPSDTADVAGSSDAADGSPASSTANRHHSAGSTTRPTVAHAGSKTAQADNGGALSAPVTLAANDPAPSPPPIAAAAAPIPAPVAAAPAPVSTPAQADPVPQAPLMTIPAPRRFTTYFPLGGSSLDSVAKSTVVDAAQYAKSAPAPRVTVDGYADTSGSAAYNLSLSHRRASSVSNELQSNGIPTDAITIAWHGETHLAIKTRDGVKMARNRRVTIGVSFAGAHKAYHRHWRRHHRHKKAG